MYYLLVVFSTYRSGFYIDKIFLDCRQWGLFLFLFFPLLLECASLESKEKQYIR